MRILVSNDDGFHAEGIQVLATELRKIAEVIIVAPDRTSPTPFRQWRLLCERHTSRLRTFSVKWIFVWPSGFGCVRH